MEAAYASISRVDTPTATDEANPGSQRLDGVENSGSEQWPMIKPLLNAVEDALVQADKN